MALNIGQVGFSVISYIEDIAQKRDAVPLHTVTEQGGYRYADILAPKRSRSGASIPVTT